VLGLWSDPTSDRKRKRKAKNRGALKGTGMTQDCASEPERKKEGKAAASRSLVIQKKKKGGRGRKKKESEDIRDGL